MKSESGANIVAGVEQFRKLYREIGRLLEQADGQMDDGGWKTRSRRCVDGSTQLSQPQDWLRTAVFRLYDCKSQKNLLAFITVFICDPEGQDRIEEPLVVAGWCDYGVGKEAEPGLAWVWKWSICHLEHKEPKFDGSIIVEEDADWLETTRFGVVRFGSLAYPLLSIGTPEELKVRIIDPLLGAIGGAE